MRSMHQSMVSQLPGRDLNEDVHDIPGSGLRKTTYDLPTLVYTLHGVEHRAGLTVEHLLGQLRSSSGIILMNDDDDRFSSQGRNRGSQGRERGGDFLGGVAILPAHQLRRLGERCKLIQPSKPWPPRAFGPFYCSGNTYKRPPRLKFSEGPSSTSGVNPQLLVVISNSDGRMGDVYAFAVITHDV